MRMETIDGGQDERGPAWPLEAASSRDNIDSSEHLKLLAAPDVQDARAQEMIILGYPERAGWVRNCGNPNSPYPKSRCGLRGWCPACSQRIALVNGGRAAAGMQRMSHRLVGLFILPIDASETGRLGRTRKLKDGAREFRVALKELRRRPCFRPVLGGVEVFEFDLSEHGRSWNLHCHVVLDVAALDAAIIEATWKELTKGRGWFSVPPDDDCKVVAADNINRFAKYMCSCASWSPAPGTIGIDHLETLQHAIKGRQLVTTWGTAGRPKRIPGGQGRKTGKSARRVPFFLHAEHRELVEAALKRAAALSNSDSRGHNLGLVAMNFLAMNDFDCADEIQRAWFIEKCEQMMGCKFMVWDPKADALVHGHDTLRLLARGPNDPKAESSEGEHRRIHGEGPAPA